MPRLFRSVTSESKKSTDSQLLSPLEPSGRAKEWPTTLSPQQEAEIRETCRKAIKKAWTRAQYNYNAGFDGTKIKSLVTWRLEDEIEDGVKGLKGLGMFEEGPKVVMHCSRLCDSTYRNADFDTILAEIPTSPMFPMHIDESDFVYRMKINAIRLKKMEQLIQPCSYQSMTESEKMDALEDDLVYFRKSQEYRLKVTLNLDPTPSPDELLHMKMSVHEADEWAWPSEIRKELDKKYARLGIDKSLDPINSNGLRSQKPSSSGILVGDDQPLPPEGDAASSKNPFAPLYGKCKKVPIVEDENSQYKRQLYERFSTHELVRECLTRSLPSYIAQGKSAVQVARDTMDCLIGRVAVGDEDMITENLERGDLVGTSRYSIAILKAWIERCEDNGW